ncbi:MAG: class I SAM-dependent methyltransferase [Alphaproteobacteria bacterium]
MDGAAWATYLVSRWQKAQGLAGDTAEIGIHHGRYFILLSLLGDDAEKAVAIDVFDNQELNVDHSGEGNYARFIANFDKFDGRRRKLVVHAIDSLRLAGRDLLKPDCPPAASVNRSFRLFSVDGSHTRGHTINDIEVAFGVLRPKGVVIVDDFYNPHWPGVQEGVHHLLDARQDICAVAYGDNKLFLVRAEDHDAYLDLFGGTMREFYADMKLVQIHGKSAVSFTMRDARRLFDKNLRRTRWAASFGRNPDGGELNVERLDGWATPVPQGTWITASGAAARIRFPKEIVERGNPVHLSLSVHPFLHGGRKARTVKIATSGGDGVQRDIDGDAVLEFGVRDFGVNGEISLTIAAGDPDVPAEIGSESSDRRTLSLFVGNVEMTLPDA